MTQEDPLTLTTCESKDSRVQGTEFRRPTLTRPIFFVHTMDHGSSWKSAKELGAVDMKLALPIKSGARKLLSESMKLALSMPKQDNVVYFCEGIVGCYVPILKKIFKKEKSVIVCRANDPSFKPRGILKTKILKCFTKHIDGYIAISPMVRDHIKLYEPNAKIELVPSYWRGVPEDKPREKTHDFVFVGYANDEKGLDIAARFVNEVNRVNNKKYSFTIVGAGNKEYLRSKKIDDTGFEYIKETPNVEPYLDRSKYIISLSRYDGGCTAVIEGLLHDCLPIISSNVGNKFAFASVAKELIFDVEDILSEKSNLNACFTAVSYKACLSRMVEIEEDRVELLSRAKPGAVKFVEDSDKFKESWRSLMQRIVPQSLSKELEETVRE